MSVRGAAASMSLRQRWLRIVRKENGGPRSWHVLLGLAKTPAQERVAEPLLNLMLAEGTFVPYGGPRDRTYGLPRGQR